VPLCPACLETARRAEAEAAHPPDPEVSALIAATLNDEQSRTPLIDAAPWLAGATDTPAPIWGQDENVLWAEGEVTLLTAAEGVGKTTLAQLVMLARAGVGPKDVLGYPVEPTNKPILYIAADRPAQARRSLNRMVTDPESVAGLIYVWRGPPPTLLNEPDAADTLLQLVEQTGAATMFIDTLSATAADLVKDEGGAGLMRTLTALVAAGIEVFANHHDRKEGAGETRKQPRISDVYGSRWIPAHAGSVLFLTGRAGDPIIKLHHIKTPAHEIGPLELVIDHDHGTVTVGEGADPLFILQTQRHLTARELADIIWPGGRAADKERARRTLERLVVDGHATRQDGSFRGAPATYHPATQETPEEGSEGGTRRGTRGTRTPSGPNGAQGVHGATQTATQGVHGVHAAGGARFTPPLGGERDPQPATETEAETNLKEAFPTIDQIAPLGDTDD